MIKETPDITEPVEVFGFSTAKEIINQTLNYQDLSKGYTCFDEPNIPSGFGNIDQITKGFKPGTLTTVSTRPGNGKTAFMLSVVYNVAVTLERKVALFSPERTAVKVINRLIESNTSHSIEKIRQGLLREGEQAHTLALIEPIASAGLFIDDTTTLDSAAIIHRCRQVHSKQNVEIILVDSPEHYMAHLQTQECRDSAFSELVTGLKAIAEELNIPVVLFNQLPKPATLVNGGFIPSLKELPEYVTASSDTVFFLHRPEYYQARNVTVPKGSIEIVFGKLYGAEVKHVTYLRFIESIDRFVNPEE
jgi:replicative DNA helicase